MIRIFAFMIVIIKIIIINIIIINITNCPLNAQDNIISYFNDNSTVIERIIDIEHYTAKLSFEPTKNTIHADVIFDIKTLRASTDSIVFYAPEFKIKNISISGSKVNFRQTQRDVIIYPPDNFHKAEKYQIEFQYSANPENGVIYFVGWNDPKNIKRKQIWSHRPHGWLPYIDGMTTVDMHITFDDDYQVFTNGERISIKQNPDGTKTWHYKMNKAHPFFSTAMIIGKYKYKTLNTGHGLPLELLYYPENESKFESTYQYSADMVDFFDDLLGFPYPYELYRQAPVIDYMYGAMETTTSTIFGDYMQIDPRAYWQRNYINVNAHELAHQWFGNCIAHLKHKDVWLTEGFATFYAKLFERSVFGEDYYQNDRRIERDKCLSLAKYNNNPVASTRAGTERYYQKGSLVLDMLNDVLGEDEFNSCITRYLKEYAFQETEINDLIRIIFDETGKDLNWFFDQWLFRGGEPHFKVSYDQYTNKDSNSFIQVTVTQIQDIGPLIPVFQSPLNIDIYFEDGTKSRHATFIHSQNEQFLIPNPDNKKVEFIVFDPAQRILKNTTFQRSFDELSAQALKAENMIDRYDALVSLRTYPIEMKIDILKKIYRKETFHLNKSEVIAQLTKSSDTNIFQEAIHDKDALVRFAVLENLTTVPQVLKKDYELLLKDFSYANIELALENLCKSFPNDTERYLEITNDEVGWRGLNIRMKWLEIAIGSGKLEFINELFEYTSPSYEFETRINSINLLVKIDLLNELTAKNILEACTHWNGKIRSASIDAIRFFMKENSSKKLLIDSFNSNSWTDYQTKKIQSILGV